MKHAVVVLQRQRGCRARSLSRSSPRARRSSAAGGPAGPLAAMEHDRVGPHQLGDLRLELQLLDRGSHHLRALRVEHHELVGVEAEPHVLRAGQLAGARGMPRRWRPRVELVQGVAAPGMGAERQDLAVDPERADAERSGRRSPRRRARRRCRPRSGAGRYAAGPGSGSDVAVGRGAETGWARRGTGSRARIGSSPQSSFTIQSPTR